MGNYQLSIPRITQLTLILGAVGILLTFALSGAGSALGFAAGVTLSLVSVRSWVGIAGAIGGALNPAPGDAPPPAVGGKAAAAGIFLILRYLLIAGAAYVSIKYLGSSPAAIFIGLLTGFAAVVLDFMLGTVFSK